MSVQLNQPVLVIGLGGAGSKLALKVKDSLNAECLLISNDKQDLLTNENSIEISTGHTINPSVQLIRGFAGKAADEIKSKISNYSSIVLMANLAGKAGAGIAPVVSNICKEAQKNTISFAIMPFKFEKDRIFNSGISLKRLQENSQCVIVLDNDALLDSNPDLTQKTCYDIANSAVMHVVDSLKSSSFSNDTNIISVGRDTAADNEDLESSLKDSMKMLYQNVPANSIKRSMLYVLGGENVPVGVLNSITTMTKGFFSEEHTQVDISTSASDDETKVMMVSAIQGETRFEKYDPLSIIPSDKTLDWDEPDCSIECKLDLYQLE